MKRVLIASLVLACSSTFAQFRDGNRLYEEMRGTQRQIAPMGYIMGVADAYVDIIFCPPEGITVGQLYDMFKVYLEANPASRHLAGDLLLHRMLKATWPCKKNGGGA